MRGRLAGCNSAHDRRCAPAHVTEQHRASATTRSCIVMMAVYWLAVSRATESAGDSRGTWRFYLTKMAIFAYTSLCSNPIRRRLIRREPPVTTMLQAGSGTFRRGPRVSPLPASSTLTISVCLGASRSARLLFFCAAPLGLTSDARLPRPYGLGSIIPRLRRSIPLW